MVYSVSLLLIVIPLMPPDYTVVLVLVPRYTRLATDPASTSTLIALKAGKAVLRQAMDIMLHPPISTCGTDRAKIPAKNIPMVRPNCVCGLAKTIRQTPNMAIIIPTPVSACTDQWHLGMLPPIKSQALNKNCGPKAMSNPNKILAVPLIIRFFTVSS
jgi:hypothetical protein